MQLTTSVASSQMTLLLAVFGIVHVDVQRFFMLHRDERVTTAQPNHQQPVEKLKQPASRLETLSDHRFFPPFDNSDHRLERCQLPRARASI
jgi:hypothetical protein